MTVKIENKNLEGTTHVQWLLAILANMTHLTYGLQCGWISSSAKFLQSDQSPTGTPLSDNEISWLASAPSFAATFCVAIYTYLVDKYGRKTCIIIITVLQAVTWIIKLCATSTPSLILARTACGMAAGGCFNVVPMYVKEISETRLRGTLGMILILAQNFGILAMYAMGGYLQYNTVLWIVTGLPILNAVALLKAPESPAFLVKLGKVDEATATIALLRGRDIDDKVVQSEIAAIQSEDERFKSIPNVTYMGILRQKAWCKGFTIMFLVMTCHGLNGAFAILNYASTILMKANVTISPELQSLSIPAFMIVGSLIAMACIERLGRKAILSTSFILCVGSFSSLAAALLVQQHGGSVPGWLPILMMVVSVTAYAAAISPIPFVIMAEMFNFQIRAKVMGVLVTTGWLFSFVQLLGFGLIANQYGSHVSFIWFAMMNVIGALVVLVLLPETRGKSVEEIELELEKRLDKK